MIYEKQEQEEEEVYRQLHKKNAISNKRSLTFLSKSRSLNCAGNYFATNLNFSLCDIFPQ